MSLITRTVVHVERVRDGFDDVPLPAYATEGAAGMDLRAAVETSVTLHLASVGQYRPGSQSRSLMASSVRCGREAGSRSSMASAS
jgi:hypothetical protein